MVKPYSVRRIHIVTRVSPHCFFSKALENTHGMARCKRCSNSVTLSLMRQMVFCANRCQRWRIHICISSPLCFMEKYYVQELAAAAGWSSTVLVCWCDQHARAKNSLLHNR